jgi:hypothetical protein
MVSPLLTVGEAEGESLVETEAPLDAYLVKGEGRLFVCVRVFYLSASLSFLKKNLNPLLFRT